MKRFVPFSNGTEAMWWMEVNCEVCKTSLGCSAKRNIEFGFIVGDISIQSAKFIGIDSCDNTLYSYCQMKDKRIISKPKKKALNTPTLF